MTQLLENAASRPVLIPTLGGVAPRAFSPASRTRRGGETACGKSRFDVIPSGARDLLLFSARKPKREGVRVAPGPSARHDAITEARLTCRAKDRGAAFKSCGMPRARRGAETRSRCGPEQGKIARFPFPAVKEPSA